jgi:hypothetical protein
MRPAELHLAPDGAPGLAFVRAPYVIETSDAERIGVDQVPWGTSGFPSRAGQGLHISGGGRRGPSAVQRASGPHGWLSPHVPMVCVLPLRRSHASSPAAAPRGPSSVSLLVWCLHAFRGANGPCPWHCSPHTLTCRARSRGERVRSDARGVASSPDLLPPPRSHGAAGQPSQRHEDAPGALESDPGRPGQGGGGAARGWRVPPRAAAAGAAAAARAVAVDIYGARRTCSTTQL